MKEITKADLLSLFGPVTKRKHGYSSEPKITYGPPNPAYEFVPTLNDRVYMSHGRNK